jgi:hypothetical protein
VPNYGLASIAQGWLTRWEAAQAARYSAWTAAPTVVAGVTAVIGTAGRLVSGGSGPAFAAVAKWSTGSASGIRFR